MVINNFDLGFVAQTPFFKTLAMELLQSCTKPSIWLLTIPETKLEYSKLDWSIPGPLWTGLLGIPEVEDVSISDKTTYHYISKSVELMKLKFNLYTAVKVSRQLSSTAAKPPAMC